MVNPRLMSLGVLQRAVLVSRPSASVRSPYVADVMLLDETRTDILEQVQCIRSEPSPSKAGLKKQLKECSEYLRGISSPESLVLAHAPSLDCAGQVVPGSVVLVAPNANPSAKTKYSIQLVEQTKGTDPSLIGYHPALAEALSKRLLTLGILSSQLRLPFTPDTSQVLSQTKYSRSRFDFAIETSDHLMLIEVKNVVCAEEVESARVRHALFPIGDASRNPSGSVSERAIKHVHELTMLEGTRTEDGRLIRAVVLFIVNRNDCLAFRPCHEADMLFAQILQKAHKKGVLLLAQQVTWGIADGEYVATAGSPLPISFDSSVDCDQIDEAKLESITSNTDDNLEVSESDSHRKRKR